MNCEVMFLYWVLLLLCWAKGQAGFHFSSESSSEMTGLLLHFSFFCWLSSWTGWSRMKLFSSFLLSFVVLSTCSLLNWVFLDCFLYLGFWLCKELYEAYFLLLSKDTFFTKFLFVGFLTHTFNVFNMCLHGVDICLLHGIFPVNSHPNSLFCPLVHFCPYDDHL